MDDKEISVVIVDDHQVVLDGFMARLELETGIEVIGTASNGLEAVDVVRQCKPDVVLMDISMPIMNGIDATRLIHEESPDAKILMLTMHDNREYIMKVMQTGAVGYMLKEISAEKMVQAIQNCESRFYLFLRVGHSNTVYSTDRNQCSETQPFESA